MSKHSSALYIFALFRPPINHRLSCLPAVKLCMNYLHSPISVDPECSPIIILANEFLLPVLLGILKLIAKVCMVWNARLSPGGEVLLAKYLRVLTCRSKHDPANTTRKMVYSYAKMFKLNRGVFSLMYSCPSIEFPLFFFFFLRGTEGLTGQC